MRNKWIAIVLALLVGGFGVHKFYLGRPITGTLYLLFCWTPVPLILSFLDFLFLLAISTESFDVLFNGHEYSG